MDVPKSSTSKEMMKVKVWARRVWTLELSLVSRVSLGSADVCSRLLEVEVDDESWENGVVQRVQG